MNGAIVFKFRFQMYVNEKSLETLNNKWEMKNGSSACYAYKPVV